MSVSNHFFDMVIGTNSDTAVSSNHDKESTSTNENENISPDGGSVNDESAIKNTMLDPMPGDASRVLVHIMRHGVIFHAQKPNLYHSLCRYQSMIQRHLSEVYLTLVLDERQGIAFIARSDSETSGSSQDSFDSASTSGPKDLLADELIDSTDDHTHSLISKRTLTLYDTLILLMLRKYYQERETSGEQKIIIDIERLSSLLTPFLPLTDHTSRDLKKLSARLKELSRRHLLSSIRGNDDRYEITPLIRYVVSADFLESMLGEYLRLAQGTTNTELESPTFENDDFEDKKYSQDDSLNNQSTNKVKSEKTSNNQSIDNQSDLFGE
ncbi:DUF4194 domain-containing protein [Psychrobacter submarinus]|uniref:DUF4194 domain-containing protein n=1 Tax=Psychrobacter submarinus TaxID=154108 RepID=UPI0019195F46|nr:DUF4194 domain-containing protein [Psychrobacter submarinus]